MLGKEAALFVPSGTMGNLLALLVHCQRGDEVIIGSKSHIYLNEAGGMAALGGIFPCPLENRRDGTLGLEEIRASIRSRDVHHTITRLICLENTQNICGGIPLTPEYTRQVAELACENGLKLHIDGARIFNSAVAQNIPVRELVDPVDSVMFCLSKGLGAPVGSMLVGGRAFIERARHLRKMLGGGMRQVGVIAAAGIVSLESMIERLDDDHARARRLAEGLRGIPALRVDKDSPSTNMVYFNLEEDARMDAYQVTEHARSQGILLDPDSARRFRLVTHYWIDDRGVDRTIQVIREALTG
jgi:threonine aldolase